MAARSKSSFEKRRKEVARKEKQRQKLERRAERKLNKGQAVAEDGQPVVTEEQSDGNDGSVQPAES